jgi:hypothetical protein
MYYASTLYHEAHSNIYKQPLYVTCVHGVHVIFPTGYIWLHIEKSLFLVTIS